MVNVPLVDTENNLLGYMEKIEAHKKGVLHRAFSLFVFDEDKLILQKRAPNKYHCPGLWTNTCCSHPSSNIINFSEIEKRLFEEMGINSINHLHLFDFIYYKQFENNLIEHEFDSIYLGLTSDKPRINKDEVSEWKYMKIKEILNDLNNEKKENYTYWFKEIMKNEKFLSSLDKLGLL